MAEIEYPIRVPVVKDPDGARQIIGEAEIDADGTTKLHITDEEYARALQPPVYSLSLPSEPTLQDFIQDGMAEAAEAAHEAVMRELDKNTKGPWNFTGLAGVPRDVMEEDAEDHIVRGTD